MDDLRRNPNRGVFVRHREGDEEHVIVFGDVDLENQGEFRNALTEAWSASPTLVVDLRNCTYMGTSGVYVLAQCAKTRYNRLRVLASPHVERVLSIVGLSQLVTAEKAASPTA